MKSLWGWSISLYRGSMEGGSGVAPSLWTLEDMLRKSLDAGISLYGIPFPSERIQVCGEGELVCRGL